MGIDIFLHSIRLVTRHFGEALRISGVLYLAAFLVSWFLQLTTTGAEREPLTILVAIVTVLVLALGWMWVAVAWHRFILLQEGANGFIPKFLGDRLLAYLGNSFLLFIVMFLAAMVVGLAMVLVTLAAGAAPALAIALMGLIVFVMLILNYRLALVLPAAAIGKQLRLGEAWGATKNATGAIVVLALVSTISSLVLDLPLFLLLGMDLVSVIVRGLWQLATGWIKLMVGVSILTTLYGHFIEGRPVSDDAIS
ncbi:hypothetical protein [Devosia sp.]|uniref:hypothetical protein n=1 Tax=Devosia sp. TaxID=1871048 RepID=UPI003BACD209